MKAKHFYGIDFGTTNSTITAINEKGELKNIELDRFSPNPMIMRSVIYVDHNHNFSFGMEAVNNYVKDIADGKIAVKKQIFTGRYIKLASPAGLGGFKKDEYVPDLMEVEVGEGGRLIQALKSMISSRFISDFRIFEKQYSVEDLISRFLKDMKEKADEVVNEDVKDVVIGRPIEFVGSNNDVAIERMMKSAKMAGFENIRFEYEPVGAAYDYGIKVHNNQTALMFDFGGGTLDLTIMKFPEKEILINTGIPIGGDLINSRIFMDKIASHFGKDETYGDKGLTVPNNIYENLKNWYSISLLKTESFSNTLERLAYRHSNPKTLTSLKSLVYNNLGFYLYEEIERAKISLTDNLNEQISFNQKDIKIHEKIIRVELEKIIETDLKDILELIDNSLEKVNLSTNDIDVVATTGGSSLIPVINQLLQNKFGKEKMKSTDAFTSVSTGLAYRAHEEFFK